MYLHKENLEINRLLVGHDLTKGLSGKETNFLSTCLERHEFKPGDVIIEENKIYRSIFLIETGNVSVIKKDPHTGHEFSIANLKEKEYVGEMSFITQNEPASASVRANSATIVRILRKEMVEHLPIYQPLVANIARLQRERIKSTNERYVKSLSEQLAQARTSKEFGMLFIITVILFGLQHFIKMPTPSTPVEEILYTWGFLILDILPFVYLLWKMKYPLQTYGVTTSGWKKSLVEGLVAAGAVSSLLILFTCITRPGAPLLPFTYFQHYPPALVMVSLTSYLFHCSLQEFIARGVIQGSLNRFMADSHFIVPIFVASLVFGICHLHKGLQIGLFTFAISFALGFLYHRHKTLIGVTLMHFSLGLLIQAMGYM